MDSLRLFSLHHRHQKEPNGTLPFTLKETWVLPHKLSHLISQLVREGGRDVYPDSDFIALSLTLLVSSLGGTIHRMIPAPLPLPEPHFSSMTLEVLLPLKKSLKS